MSRSIEGDFHTKSGTETERSTLIILQDFFVAVIWKLHSFFPLRTIHWKTQWSLKTCFNYLFRCSAGRALARRPQQYFHHPPHRQLHVSSSVCLRPWIKAFFLNAGLPYWLSTWGLFKACFMFFLCTLIVWIICLKLFFTYIRWTVLNGGYV